MKFIKTYDESTVTIYQNKKTGMKIEYLKFEKFFILYDEENFIIWEFNTLSEAIQGAKDYLN